MGGPRGKNLGEIRSHFLQQQDKVRRPVTPLSCTGPHHRTLRGTRRRDNSTQWISWTSRRGAGGRRRTPKAVTEAGSDGRRVPGLPAFDGCDRPGRWLPPAQEGHNPDRHGRDEGEMCPQGRTSTSSHFTFGITTYHGKKHADIHARTRRYVRTARSCGRRTTGTLESWFNSGNDWPGYEGPQGSPRNNWQSARTYR